MGQNNNLSKDLDAWKVRTNDEFEENVTEWKAFLFNICWKDPTVSVSKLFFLMARLYELSRVGKDTHRVNSGLLIYSEYTEKVQSLDPVNKWIFFKGNVGLRAIEGRLIYHLSC